MSRRRWWLLGGSVLLIPAALLAWAARDLVRQTVVEPVAYLFWLVDLIIRSLPQTVFWYAPLLVALVYAGWTLLRHFTPPPSPENLAAAAGRVTHWLDILGLSSQPGFVGHILLRELRVLVINALAHRDQRPASEIWKQLRRGDLPLSPDLRTYLRDGRNATPSPPSYPYTPAPPQVEGIVQFLEKHLESKHDH